ncbi:hypothetical protein QJS04_geneDACA010257 [Acorus gramineus]|uniref:Uncharacterized protein n=1 Tax=Acorus gramineus TaxID=55184 RepID=A0AAV9A4T4_ACOGR|nr:hypothetical protein QJS04_geneDACA010257 [Acorus gramineus]
MKGYMSAGDAESMLGGSCLRRRAVVGSSMDCAFAFGSEGVNALLSVTQLQGLAEGSSPISPGPSCSTTLANVITSST